MGVGSKLLGGLKSEAFRNTSTAASALCAVAALVVSILSFQNAAETRRSQDEVVKRQGEFLELGSGFVQVQTPEGDWKQYIRPTPNDPVIEVPLAEWQSAQTRVVTLRLLNSGQQDAYIEQFYIELGGGNEIGSYQDGDVLKPKCGYLNGDQGPCPDVVHPHDGYAFVMDIPSYVVDNQTEDRRANGLQVCVLSRTAKKNCSDVGVAVPAGAK